MWKKFGGFIIKMTGRIIRTMICQTGDALKKYRSAPSQSLCVLFSSAGCAVTAIGFITAIILFGINGGYSGGFSSQSDRNDVFTSGNVSLLYEGITGIIAATCIIAGAVFLAIVFLHKASLAKRIIMITDTVLIVIFVGMTIFCNSFVIYRSNFTDEQWTAVNTFFSIVDYQTVLKTLLIASLFTIVIFAGLLFFSDARWLLAHVCKSAVISFVVFPILLLIAENLVALIGFIILFAVMWIGGNFILGDTPSVGSGNIGSADVKAYTNSKSEKKRVEKKTEIKEINVANGYRLYLDEGSGIGAPMTTCVFVDTATLNHKYLCTLKDFKEGKVIIKKGGKQITHLQ